MQLELFPETCFYHNVIRNMLLRYCQNLKIEIANEYWAYSYEALILPIIIGVHSCEQKV